jgi:glycogen synthase
MSMRILICSYDFYPIIGGCETAGETLATGLGQRGYEVTVVTTTPGAGDDAKFPFSTIRRPGAGQLVQLYRDCDLVWHNEVSLRQLWPLFLVRRPLVLVHHCSLAEVTSDSTPTRFPGLKRAACMLGHNAFVSEALRKVVDLPGPVIYNSYDEANFHAWPDVARDRDVVFLGRLVREKGADILVDALALLAAKGMPLHATIIGSGPYEDALKAQVSKHGIADLVEFTGTLRGEALSRTLARHRLMAMPSRLFEAFGISAIEAMACGCVVAGAKTGGLPEAIGPCGVVTAKDSAAELAQALARLATDRRLYESCASQIGPHLKLFSQAALMDRCEQLIGEATGAHRASTAAGA